MLSITSATVHRPMCPNTSKNSPERKEGPWSRDINVNSRHSCRSSASKKNLSLRLTDMVDLNVQVSHHSPVPVHDNKATAAISKTLQLNESTKNQNILKSEKNCVISKCNNRLHREEAPNKAQDRDNFDKNSWKSNAHDNNTDIFIECLNNQGIKDEKFIDRNKVDSLQNSSDFEENEETFISSNNNNNSNNNNSVGTPITTKMGEKRKRGVESRISIALKMLKSHDNQLDYSKCRSNLELTETNLSEDEISNSNTVDKQIKLENILPEPPELETHQLNNQEENWDNNQLNWDNPSQENWDTLENLDVTNKIQDPFGDIPYYMTGFPNPPGENRCWLNATLQTLFALPFVDQLGRLNLNRSSVLTKTLVAMQMFWKEGPTEKQKTYQTVTRFKEQLQVLDESYSSHRQQDVSEFLMIFLNHVKNDCEELLQEMHSERETENVPYNLQNLKNIQRSPQSSNKRPPLTQISPFKRRINFNESLDRQILVDESNSKSQKSYNEPHYLGKIEQSVKNPIDEFFLLPMMEHYVCQNCAQHRQRKVDNLMLYVDLPENETDSINLADAINKTLAPEDRNLACGKCKSNNHKVYTTFRATPNVLIVQINRYGKTSEGFVAKMNSTVHIPSALTIQSNVSLQDNEEAQEFTPVCIIAHVGGAMDCGHYTSYVKHGDQWFHYNDMSVTPMSSTEALAAPETTAYLVFLVNINFVSKSWDFSEISSEKILR